MQERSIKCDWSTRQFWKTTLHCKKVLLSISLLSTYFLNKFRYFNVSYLNAKLKTQKSLHDDVKCTNWTIVNATARRYQRLQRVKNQQDKGRPCSFSHFFPKNGSEFYLIGKIKINICPVNMFLRFAVFIIHQWFCNCGTMKNLSVLHDAATTPHQTKILSDGGG